MAIGDTDNATRDLSLPNCCIIFVGTAYDSFDKKFEPIVPV